MTNKLTSDSGSLEPNLYGIDSEIGPIDVELNNPVDEVIRVTDVLDADGKLETDGNEALASHVKALAEEAKPIETVDVFKPEVTELKGIPENARHVLRQWSYTAPVTVTEMGSYLRIRHMRRSMAQQVAQNELNVIISAMRDAHVSPIPSLYE